jgi:citrate lyase subunit beta/citryl-CoA lyase
VTRRIRSLLFAPATKPELVPKLLRSAPDAVAIDLEDAVAPDLKVEARHLAAEAVATLVDAGPDGPIVFVRVNAGPTEWFADDVATLHPGTQGVILPKTEDPAQIAELRSALAARSLDPLVLGGIESAAGVHRAVDIAAAADVVYFGAEDYVADLGGVRTPEGTEVLYARSRVALAARLASAQALDQVVTDYRDDAGFDADAAVGRSLGYTGKLCIHPAQVARASDAFRPSSAELERARGIVAAYEAALARGQAACSYDGQMVDEPVVRQARSILDSAD